MSFKEIQEQVDKWTSQYTPQYFPNFEIIARLAEEVGELARETSHMYGTKKKKPTEEKGDMANEIADVIFTLVCLANSQNISLDEAWKRMTEKHETRDKDRFTKV